MPSTTIVIYVLMIGLMFVMWNNGRKRKKAAAEMTASLKPGTHVMLTSGFFCTIISMDTDRATVRSGDSTLVVALGAIARVVEAPVAKTVTEASPAKPAVAKKPVAKKTPETKNAK